MWDEVQDDIENLESLTPTGTEEAKRKISNCIGIEISKEQFDQLKQTLDNRETKKLLETLCNITVVEGTLVKNVDDKYFPLFISCQKSQKGLDSIYKKIITTLVPTEEGQLIIARSKGKTNLNTMKTREKQVALLDIENGSLKFDVSTTDLSAAQSYPPAPVANSQDASTGVEAVPLPAAEAGVEAVGGGKASTSSQKGLFTGFWDNVWPSGPTTRSVSTAAERATANSNAEGPAPASAAVSESAAGGADEYAKTREDYETYYDEYRDPNKTAYSKKQFRKDCERLELNLPATINNKQHAETYRLIKDANPHVWPHGASDAAVEPWFPDDGNFTTPPAEACNRYAAFCSEPPSWQNVQPSAYAPTCDCQNQPQYWSTWQSGAYAHGCGVGMQEAASEPLYVPSSGRGQQIYSAAQEYYPLAPYADSPYFSMYP